MKPLKNPEKKQNITQKRTVKKQSPDSSHFEKETFAYFQKRQKKLKIVATTKTPGGQILDWIPIESQHPKGIIAQPPPQSSLILPKGTKKEQIVKFELEHQEVERGPEGTVPILRKDLKKLRLTKSLKRYLSKHRNRSKQFARTSNGLMIPMPEEGGNHRYASTGQSTTCYGGEGVLSAFDPYVESSDDFSLMQIGLSNSSSTMQTVEAGWQEMQDIYGDWVPHLFLFYTTNNYTDEGDNKGGYNRDVDGWVQYDGSVYPGAISRPNSTRCGGQYVMRIKFQLYQGNWWFSCNSRWLGYYPASLFFRSGLANHADWIGFWGEIYDSDDVAGKTTTDMGSGYWPDAGWTWSAYQRNLLVQTNSAGHLTNYNGAGSAPDPDMYDLITHMNSGSSWGSYFWMGGPGAG